MSKRGGINNLNRRREIRGGPSPKDPLCPKNGRAAKGCFSSGNGQVPDLVRTRPLRDGHGRPRGKVSVPQRQIQTALRLFPRRRSRWQNLVQEGLSRSGISPQGGFNLGRGSGSYRRRKRNTQSFYGHVQRRDEEDHQLHFRGTGDRGVPCHLRGYHRAQGCRGGPALSG